MALKAVEKAELLQVEVDKEAAAKEAKAEESKAEVEA
jgi:hypothetical protein